MQKKALKKNTILGILFLLPVLFVIVMLFSEENYMPADIVKQNIVELPTNSNEIQLKDHLTLLAFFGKHPMDKSVAALNLKELIYDKFKGFKKFQIVVVIPNEAKEEAERLFKEIATYEDLRFWHFFYADKNDIIQTFNSLESNVSLDANLATNHIFIVDTDLSQRGRIDDRSDKELEKNSPQYALYSYNCVEVGEIKNKLSDDMRVLFTEYRQKRKGNFDSSSRRAEDLKDSNEQD